MASIVSRCGARRMVESAALLVDEALPRLSMHQWVWRHMTASL